MALSALLNMIIINIFKTKFSNYLCSNSPAIDTVNVN